MATTKTFTLTPEQRTEIHRKANIPPKTEYTKEELLGLFTELLVVLKLSQCNFCHAAEINQGNFSMWKNNKYHQKQTEKHAAHRLLTHIFCIPTAKQEKLIDLDFPSTNSVLAVIDANKNTTPDTDIVIFSFHREFTLPVEYKSVIVIYFDNNSTIPLQPNERHYIATSSAEAKVLLAMHMMQLSTALPIQIPFGVVAKNTYVDACSKGLPLRKLVHIPHTRVAA